MTNNSLYTKYRPRNFDEIYGQKYVSEILRNQVKLKKFTHAYLFSGTRGTGKTSCARIFAKAINCLNPVDGNPCYNCNMCNQENANILNVFELDAASNNSVDQIKNIIEELIYVDFLAGYKVYILDEVHMLSINAFNALLKTLEEPPSNVVFILSTTEVKKIPQTVSSRCQKFEFKYIEFESILDRIKYICESEKIDIDHESLRIVSYMGNGSMRDSISVLETILLYTNCIREEIVREILGMVSGETIFKFLTSLLDKNINNSLRVVSEIFDVGSCNIKSFMVTLRNYLRDLIFLKLDNMNFDLLFGQNSRDLPIMIEISERIEIEELFLILDNINKILDKDLFVENEYRIYLEMFIFDYAKKNRYLIENFNGVSHFKSAEKQEIVKTSEHDLVRWDEFLMHLKNCGLMVLYSLLQNGTIGGIVDGRISFKCNTIGILKRLSDISTIKQVENELIKFCGKSFSFNVFSDMDGGGLSIEDKMRDVFDGDFDIENK